jgi:predicted enzyme related to lactoylglutathione lyase
MPTRASAPTGAPCWLDLITDDTDGARSFYGRLLGWVAQEPNPDFGGYFSFEKDGVLVAGCMGAQPSDDGPRRWTVYLATDDIDKTVAAATERGGELGMGPHAVADLGRMAFISDPAGTTVGLWEAGTHKGFGVIGEPGAPTWFELHTPRYDDVIPFYSEIGHLSVQTVAESQEMRYSTLHAGDDPVAGVMDIGGGDGQTPGQWFVYFGVEDTDAAVATVTELGGRVVEPAVDTPYGRLATVADPTGIMFKLVSTSDTATSG